MFLLKPAHFWNEFEIFYQTSRNFIIHLIFIKGEKVKAPQEFQVTSAKVTMV